MDKIIDIKALRKRLGWSLEKLGSELGGLHHTTVSRWERGITVPRGPARLALEALEDAHPPQPETGEAA